MWDPPEMEVVEGCGYSYWYAAELAMRAGHWIRRSRGRGEDLQLAYLFLWSQSFLRKVKNLLAILISILPLAV